MEAGLPPNNDFNDGEQEGAGPFQNTARELILALAGYGRREGGHLLQCDGGRMIAAPGLEA